VKGNDEPQRLRDLQQVTDAALSYLPLDQLLDELLERVREILEVDTAAILLLSEDGRTLVARAAKGLEEEVERGVRVPVGRGFAGRIAADRRPVRIADTSQADIFNPILREKGLVSLLGVPMLVEGRVIGVLHVGTLHPRRFDGSDSDLLQRTADRAALAINARLYERQRGLTEEIQRSLFPTPLPSFPGVELAARYYPAAAAPLGGDWYDAFMLPGGALGLAIGDVVGRGFRAAALMGQLRSALRAYALDEGSPVVIVSKLNVLLRQIEPGGSATLLYLVLDPATGTATMSSAGHPPPVMTTADGAREFLALPPSVPLGVAANVAYEERSVQVDPPARLLLFTDGVVERSGESLEEGLERLRQAMPAGALLVEEACDSVAHTMLPEGASKDDAALLLVDATPLPDPLVVTLPAEPDSPPLLRRILRRWLRNVGASEREIDELILACAEACANAIEHAYPPEPHQFRVEGRCEHGAVTLTVRDWGQWRPPRGEYRGRGLMLMEGLADSVEVSPGDEGTTVILTRRLLEAQRA
jgi:anti-sigma regulatory factor (Ser/Thr protein kinase)/putative methionine-R-sulfoxide reductase with GAF domain